MTHLRIRSWKSDSATDSQENGSISVEGDGSLPYSLVPILNQINPDNAPPPLKVSVPAGIRSPVRHPVTSLCTDFADDPF